MHRMLTLVWNTAVPTWLYKDVCAFSLYLAKYESWETEFCYFSDGIIYLDNMSISKYVKFNCLGNIKEHCDQYIKAKEFLKKNINDYDVLCLFGYVGTNYKIANIVKSINKNIKIWIKLDMNEVVYHHYYERNICDKIKNYAERWRSRNIDLFTVETFQYYDILKNTRMFMGGRLKYLTNGVYDYGVDVNEIDKIQKENIIVAVGRMGVYEKNYELLLDSLKYINKDILKEWKIYFIGSRTKGFDTYKDLVLKENIYLKEYVSFIDEIKDRKKLYRWLRRAKIYCMTSRSEGFPLATIEAIYWGTCPVITNYGMSVKDIVNDNSLGNIVYTCDPIEYAKKLEIRMINETSYSNIEEYARKKFGYQYLVKKVKGYLIGI